MSVAAYEIAPQQHPRPELAHLAAARVALAGDLGAGHRLLEGHHAGGVPGHLRHVRDGAGGVEHEVEAAQFVHRRCVVEPDVDVEVQQLVPDPVQVPAHLLLARDEADVEHRPAQLGVLLEQRHLVAALGGDPGSLHAGGPPADDRHAHGARGGLHLRVRVVAAARVDRAGDLLLRHQRLLPAAAQAGDALADGLHLPVLRLDRPVGIRQELPGEPDKVRLALGQDLLAVLRVAQRVAGDDRDPDDLLDGLGGVRCPALGVLHRVEAGAGALLHALREVDGGAPGALQDARGLDALLHPPAALAPLLERVADQDREGLAALLLDRVDDREREAHPVLEAAAEPVVAHVQVRAHELRQEVAVRRVELDRVEAGLLHPPGRLAEQVHELQDLGDRGFADLLALLLGVLVDDLVTG